MTTQTSPPSVYRIPAWDIPSETTPGRYYRVSIDLRTELYTCECPDHQKRFRDCKHIKRVQAARLLFPLTSEVTA
jgi:hypothetical protein